MTATDRTRIPRPTTPRWGVVCSDGDVVWARDEAAARRLLTSLVGASRIVRQDPGEPDSDAQSPSSAGPR